MIYAMLALLLLGFAIGVCYERIKVQRWSRGTLRIDRSDETSAPYLFLELNDSIEHMEKKGHVIFRVASQNHISQK